MILALKCPFWPLLGLKHLGPCMTVCVCVYFWSSDGDDEKVA